VTLFLDTNVVLDVLARREPWVHDAAALLSLIEEGEAIGLVAPHGLATTYYLLAKWQDRPRANQALADLMRIVRVEPLDHDAVLRALALGWTDFEDALHAVCAQNAGANHLVTRNPDDFRKSAVPPISPPEVLALIRTQEDASPP
jgi:predicted nucleic acid-binding protein